MKGSVVAFGELQLTPINDGLGISITPASCIIKANFDGSNPDLSQATTEISLLEGGIKTPFEFSIVEVSNPLIQYKTTVIDEYATRLTIKGLPTDILSGHIKFRLATKYNSFISGTFSFSVIRESTMLDWIQDWENNKTQIGSTYLISPRIFVGKRVSSEDGELGELTGVYIGPDTDKTAGIYGYKESTEIFHINENGGCIGGWKITATTMQTLDGLFQISSEGSIFVKDTKETVLWEIKKDGSASFSKGKVLFDKDGSASFEGTITSANGHIGGWGINKNTIRSDHMILNSSQHYLGISPFNISDLEPGQAEDITHKIFVKSKGGVYIHYTSDNSYGIEGYLPASAIDESTLKYNRTFALGSFNSIANWNFDSNALWIGTKKNTAGQYASEGSMTIGDAGLRGAGWYIDNSGDISFLSGLLSFNKESGTLLGWNMTDKRLSTSHVAIISESEYSGIYLSSEDISNLPSSTLKTNISKKGGIYCYSTGQQTQLAGHASDGSIVFSLNSSGDSSIAGWSFNETAIFCGTLKEEGFTNNPGDITMSRKALCGFKWRFDANGAGALAGGNISWDVDGNVIFKNDSSISWEIPGISDRLTKIDKDGIYTGTISADDITSGTISTADIKNVSETWCLNQDGSGKLANGNISWDKEGKVSVNGTIVAKNFYRPFSNLDELASSDIFYISPDDHGNAFFVSFGSQYGSQYSGMNVYLPAASKYPGLEITLYTPYTPITRVPVSMHYINCQEDSFLYFGDEPVSEGQDIPNRKRFYINHLGGMVELVSTGDGWLIKNIFGDIQYT